MRSILRETSALCEAERSQDSSADLDHGSKDLGPKVTLAGALAFVAALTVEPTPIPSRRGRGVVSGATGSFWDVFFLAHNVLVFLHME